MTSSDEKLERGLLRTFHRYGGESSRDALLRALDPQSQDRILVLCRPREEEKVVLVGAGHQDDLLVVTTRRLIFTHGDEVRSVEAADIRRVTVDLAGEVELGHRSKREWRTLMVELNSGEKNYFALQERIPFWAFLNAVKWLVDRMRGPIADARSSGHKHG